MSGRPDQPDRGDHDTRRPRIGYLTNQYPKTSHTFIRRELQRLESMGYPIVRMAVRDSGEEPADPVDRDERRKTWHLVSQGVGVAAGATARALGRSPSRWVSGLARAMRLGWASERGVLLHLIYFAEACLLAETCRAEGVEHLHVHFATNPATVALLARSVGGPPFSMTVHGPDEFDAPASLSLGPKVEASVFTVAISHYGAAQLRRWVRPQAWDKIEVIRCAVGPEWFEQATPIDAESRQLVCVGRLTPQKGQLTLLEAMARVVRDHPDASLVLAGDGELRAPIERRIRELGLERQVTITGWVSEQRVRELLRGSRALVLPSAAEGLPVVLMEAMAMGRPVVTTYVAGIPELVTDGRTGWLVPAGDAAALEGAMRAVLDASAAELEAVASAGREAVRRQHDLATEVGKLAERIERSVAAESRDPARVRERVRPRAAARGARQVPT